MHIWPASPASSTKTARNAGPPRIFWVAQFVAAIVIGLPLLVYGIYCLQTGEFSIPYGFRARRLVRMDGGAAQLAAWACVVGGIAAALHAGLTSIDRIKHAAATAARFAAGVALLLFIAAVAAHLVG